MKILITGATGNIGSEVLNHTLKHPAVTRVIAFSRRSLSSDLEGKEKLECVIIEDFNIWPESILKAHSDADAMIWSGLADVIGFLLQAFAAFSHVANHSTKGQWEPMTRIEL